MNKQTELENPKIDIKETNKSIVSYWYRKTFAEQNLFKALPFLAIPSVIIGLIFLVIDRLAPAEFLKYGGTGQIVFYTLVPTIVAALLIALRLYLRNSLYFKVSLNIVLSGAILVVATYIDYDAGTTLLKSGIIFGSAIIFVVMMILFTVESIKQPVALIMKEMNRIAEGNLDVENQGLKAYSTEFGKLEDTLIEMAAQLQQIVGSIEYMARTLSTNSEEFAASTEELNASSEEISSVIQQMSRGAQQQAEQINATVISVQELSQVVEQTVTNISSTVELITDVANQTNMLALNAAIEAARAGDYGRGFAVVADNVRRLAEDTKNNTNNIAGLVEDIQKQISASVKKIARSVDSVAAVAEETAASSEEAASAVEEQTASAEEMSASAQDLARMAEELSSLLTVFRTPGKQGYQKNTLVVDNERTRVAETSQKHKSSLIDIVENSGT
ncbi:MAG: methyl-accepting chemotaxis protein [Candidatus Odinarchaeota archaeon]